MKVRSLREDSQMEHPRICWEGPQFVNQSLAVVNRAMEYELARLGEFELSVVPTCEDDFVSFAGSKYLKLLEYYATESPELTAITVRHHFPPSPRRPRRGLWVLMQPWEFGGLPHFWVEKINREIDEAWVPTNIVRSMYLDSGVAARKVHVIPHGVDVEQFHPAVTPFAFPHGKKFRFLFVGGTIRRKGFDLVLRAYREVFSRRDDVVLVVKDVMFYGDAEGLRATVLHMLNDKEVPEICYLDSEFTETQMASLYCGCDCLVHPYRGEGFALPVLEARACGRPVIVTAGGATDDFVDGSSGLRIPSIRTVFGNRSIGGFDTVGDLWQLEPDHQELGRAMRWVYEHNSEASRMGEQARDSVRRNWTWSHAACKARDRLLRLL